MPSEIRRGEFYEVDWPPGRGSEQGGRRPALIVQNNIGNKFSPTTIVAACITADVKAYPFIVSVIKKESGLPQNCKVNLSTLLTIDNSRLINKCGELTEEKMEEVDQAIKNSLGLDEKL